MRGCPFLPFGSQGAPALFAAHLFVVIAYYSVFFFFFLWVGVGLSRGYADLGQGFLCEYCMPLSSPCGLHLPNCLGAGFWSVGAILVSLFDVEWKC
jgi:hypothetical protein